MYNNIIIQVSNAESDPYNGQGITVVPMAHTPSCVDVLGQLLAQQSLAVCVALELQK